MSKIVRRYSGSALPSSDGLNMMKTALKTPWGNMLAAKLGARSIPLPTLSTKSPSSAPEISPAALQSPSTNQALLCHFSALLTRHGKRGESIVVQVQAQSQLRYAVSNPVQMAIDAIKPVVKYYKSKVTRQYVPLALYPKTAESMALRWLIEAASSKTYVGGRPNIVRGLVDEIDSIMDGSSSLYQKKFNTHRNPS